MRSLYQNNPNSPGKPNYFCCFVQEYGPIFTPAPNTVNTVRTNLGMVEQPVPPYGDFNTVSQNDFIALSFLDTGAEIPLYAVQSGEAYYFAPAPTASTMPAPNNNPLFAGYTPAGVALAMSADIQPINSGGGGTPSIGATGLGRLLPGSAQVPLICRLRGGCHGSLTLQSAPGRALDVTFADPRAAFARARSKSKPKLAIFGRSSISIRSGRSVKVKVRLNNAGRRFVRGRRRVTLWARVTLNGNTTVFAVTLKR